MAKKLLVKVPVTKDGRTLAYGSDKQPLFTEHILELAAKKHYEALNAKLPEELRYILSEVDDEAGKPLDATALVSTELLKKDHELNSKNEELQSKEKELEVKENALKTKDQEIEQLKAQLETVKRQAAEAQASQATDEKASAEKKAGQK